MAERINAEVGLIDGITADLGGPRTGALLARLDTAAPWKSLVKPIAALPEYRVKPVGEDKGGRPAWPALTGFTKKNGETYHGYKEHIFTRFDHTHLNEDTVVFNIAHGGVNPSVEKIARVCFELLSPGIRAAARRADRRHFTVWKAR